jgi:hypothetical protein
LQVPGVLLQRPSRLLERALVVGVGDGADLGPAYLIEGVVDEALDVAWVARGQASVTALA